MSSSRYRVVLSRPVFQVVMVDVVAEDREDAMVKALSHAGMVPEEEWTGVFDPADYFYDVQHATEAEEAEIALEHYGYSADRYTKYLLLKADTFAGEGEVLMQPWVNRVSDQMADDIFREWTSELEKIGAGGASKFLERLTGKAEEAKGKPAKVIPIRRPPPEDE